ncbi:MAG: Sec-independent secretion TatD [Promethearchaeota archaeon CR_4]|nr:MAG: Sec-independent secretion TatD [Candidatus Lokiarchaeota archaeon CR_4]
MLIDTHCHLDEYENPLDIISAAEAVGVGGIIAVGMHVTKFQKVLDLAAQFPMVHPALGIHPEEVKDHPSIDQEFPLYIDLIRENAPKLVAIAEIGLDHHFVKNPALWSLEERIFLEMLPIAEQNKLPVSLHVKDAEMRVLDLLTSYELPAVVIHWFSGPSDIYKTAIDRGYYFSIPQAIRYSPIVQKTAQETPLEQLLLESDGPATFKGIVGEPKDCALVITEIARRRNVSREELEVIIESNTRKTFPRVFSPS